LHHADKVVAALCIAGSIKRGGQCRASFGGSPGVEGGKESPVQKLYKIDVAGSPEVIGGWCDDGSWLNPLLTAHRFQPGEAFQIETTGGGGWGSP